MVLEENVGKAIIYGDFLPLVPVETLFEGLPFFLKEYSWGEVVPMPTTNITNDLYCFKVIRGALFKRK